MKYKREFDKFIKLMKQGIEIGQQKYGDKGLFGDSQLRMLQEEVRDQAVYSFLTWLKVELLIKGLVKRSDLKELTDMDSLNRFEKKYNISRTVSERFQCKKPNPSNKPRTLK